MRSPYLLAYSSFLESFSAIVGSGKPVSHVTRHRMAAEGYFCNALVKSTTNPW